jgi:hypothetical protein
MKILIDNPDFCSTTFSLNILENKRLLRSYQISWNSSSVPGFRAESDLQTIEKDTYSKNSHKYIKCKYKSNNLSESRSSFVSLSSGCRPCELGRSTFPFKNQFSSRRDVIWDSADFCDALISDCSWSCCCSTSFSAPCSFDWILMNVDFLSLRWRLSFSWRRNRFWV